MNLGNVVCSAFDSRIEWKEYPDQFVCKYNSFLTVFEGVASI